MNTHFPLSQRRAEDTDETSMDIPTTSRFATTFKRLRLEKRWKQEELAKALHVTQRAVVSWETGTRIPSPGMVVLLCIQLTSDQGATTDLLSHELLIAYLRDDMERQTKVHRAEAFRLLVDQGLQRLQHLSEEHSQPEQPQEPFPLSFEQAVNTGRRGAEVSQPAIRQAGEAHHEESADVLQQFFALFDQLRQHPELITVAHDFLRELVQ